jgi:hypothetical protein
MSLVANEARLSNGFIVKVDADYFDFIITKIIFHTGLKK